MSIRKLLLALVCCCLIPGAHALVKQSASGICHPPESRYYDSTNDFIAHGTLQDCLSAGGRLPAHLKSGGFPSPTASSAGPSGRTYEREHFGRGWADENGDCRDSRQEALIAQSTAPVRYKGQGKQCRVASGRWISPFTGAVIHDPSGIDIDHVVPLKWAWEHGADGWTKDQRIRFANDPVNLLSVEASLNREKGAKGPDRWLPPAGQCQYVSRFLRVVKSYGLLMDNTESVNFQGVHQSACRISRSDM